MVVVVLFCVRCVVCCVLVAGVVCVLCVGVVGVVVGVVVVDDEQVGLLCWLDVDRGGCQAVKNIKTSKWSHAGLNRGPYCY